MRPWEGTVMKAARSEFARCLALLQGVWPGTAVGQTEDRGCIR